MRLFTPIASNAQTAYYIYIFTRAHIYRLTTLSERLYYPFSAMYTKNNPHSGIWICFIRRFYLGYLKLKIPVNCQDFKHVAPKVWLPIHVNTALQPVQLVLLLSNLNAELGCTCVSTLLQQPAWPLMSSTVMLSIGLPSGGAFSYNSVC